jgi:hypothetical protein
MITVYYVTAASAHDPFKRRTDMLKAFDEPTAQEAAARLNGAQRGWTDALVEVRQESEDAQHHAHGGIAGGPSSWCKTPGCSYWVTAGITCTQCGAMAEKVPAQSAKAWRARRP